MFGPLVLKNEEGTHIERQTQGDELAYTTSRQPEVEFILVSLDAET